MRQTDNRLRPAERRNSAQVRESSDTRKRIAAARPRTRADSCLVPVWRAAGWQPWTGSSSWCWNDDSRSSPRRMLLAPPEESAGTWEIRLTHKYESFFSDCYLVSFRATRLYRVMSSCDLRWDCHIVSKIIHQRCKWSSATEDYFIRFPHWASNVGLKNS